MRLEHKVPSAAHIIRAIVGREVRSAWRRWWVKVLLALSLVPIIIYGVVLVIQVMSSQVGIPIELDDMAAFISAEQFFMGLLVLGLGTPIIARDRREDVMFLYATRPVSPLHYTAGKLLAVAIPAILLLLVPLLLLTLLRVGILPDVDASETFKTLGKVLAVSTLIGLGYSGLVVGVSALVKKSWMALLICLALIAIFPNIVGVIALLADTPEIGTVATGAAADALINVLFVEDSKYETSVGVAAAISLTVWGLIGALLPTLRIQKEMIP